MSNPEILSITWGSVPICALVSMVLDGCLTMQTYTYFRRFFHRDHPALKYTVAIIWFFSISHVVCGVWVMHNICVAGYYLPANDIIIPLGFAMEFLAQSFVNFGVQAIYVSRLFRFSHNVRLLICLCVPLAVQIGIGFFAALRVAHTVPAWQVDVWNEEWGWMVTTPFAICASMDVAITVSVCHQLWRTRMAGLKRTQNMVDKLIRWTIQTGVLTSSLVFIIVILKNVQKHSYAWIGISSIASDCYANGLLALLNARTSLGDSNITDYPSGLGLPTTIVFLPRTSASVETVVCNAPGEPESDK